jgi:dihydrofolate synthase/folylpolyglutamate synthase
MTYNETLEYLYTQLPMFTRIGEAAYKKDLHNTVALCSALGNPQQHFKSIHVAGTNGKGSTCHMLAAIFQQAGYKTGLYTSPHIKEFGERIRINGEKIQEPFVVDFVERTKSLSEQIAPSFFELTVALAFDYFAQEKVDIAIIETGLGGRLDSTNIISPILSVITNIGFDHMNLLGNTLQEIAWQKAGIIKKNTPVVVGEALPETSPLFVQEAAEMEAPLFFAESRYEIADISSTHKLLSCRLHDLQSQTEETITIDLNGSYQAKNLCTVMLAVDLLNKQGYQFTKKTVQLALEKVKTITGISGRWDIVQENPRVIHDVAHNKDGIKQVIRQLKNDYPDSNIHFVLGFVKDKDVEQVLPLFPENASYYFTNAHIPRALPHQELKTLAASKNLLGKSFDDVNEAIEAAKIACAPNDVIMVCGSFFIIGEIA